jgi:hypothetical protein
LAPVFYIDSTFYDSPYLFWKILGGKQGQNFQKNEWLLRLQILVFLTVYLNIVFDGFYATFFNLVLIVL